MANDAAQVATLLGLLGLGIFGKGKMRANQYNAGLDAANAGLPQGYQLPEKHHGWMQGNQQEAIRALDEGAKRQYKNYETDRRVRDSRVHMPTTPDGVPQVQPFEDPDLAKAFFDQVSIPNYQRQFQDDFNNQQGHRMGLNQPGVDQWTQQQNMNQQNTILSSLGSPQPQEPGYQMAKPPVNDGPYQAGASQMQLPEYMTPDMIKAAQASYQANYNNAVGERTYGNITLPNEQREQDKWQEEKPIYGQLKKAQLQNTLTEAQVHQAELKHLPKKLANEDQTASDLHEERKRKLSPYAAAAAEVDDAITAGVIQPGQRNQAILTKMRLNQKPTGTKAPARRDQKREMQLSHDDKRIAHEKNPAKKIQMQQSRNYEDLADGRPLTYPEAGLADTPPVNSAAGAVGAIPGGLNVGPAPITKPTLTPGAASYLKKWAH